MLWISVHYTSSIDPSASAYWPVIGLLATPILLSLLTPSLAVTLPCSANLLAFSSGGLSCWSISSMSSSAANVIYFSFLTMFVAFFFMGRCKLELTRQLCNLLISSTPFLICQSSSPWGCCAAACITSFLSSRMLQSVHIALVVVAFLVHTDPGAVPEFRNQKWYPPLPHPFPRSC